MDEPCSALDPIATARIEELMQEIKTEYTIVIVTHNMQQAARVSDRTAFFTTEVNPESDRRTGRLVEFDADDEDLLQPRRRAHRDVRHRAVRMSDDERLRRRRRRPAGVGELRPGFHHELDELRERDRQARRPRVTESIPRATEILLGQDLEGAEYMILADDEIDAKCARARGALLPSCSPCSRRSPATCARSSPRCGSSPRSSAPPTSPSTSARRRGASTATQLDPRCAGSSRRWAIRRSSCSRRRPRRTSTERRRPGRRARRHGHLPRRPAARVRPGDLREPLRRADRPAGRRAARRRRPLLRAHRRPRRQHRRAGPLPRHRLDARAATAPPATPSGRRRATWNDVRRSSPSSSRRSSRSATWAIARRVGRRRAPEIAPAGRAAAAPHATAIRRRSPTTAAVRRWAIRGRPHPARRRRDAVATARVRYRNAAARALAGTHTGLLVDDAVERRAAAARSTGDGVARDARAVRAAAGRRRRDRRAAARRRRRSRRSRTSASAAASTPCAPTSSPTSATS